MSKQHVLKVRVYYEDTDAGGIVYYASYLRFTERARSEMMRDFGYPLNTMIAESGSFFVVRRVEADYLASAVHDDLIEVHTKVDKVGKSSIILKQAIVRDGKILVDTSVTLVCINANGRPTRIPEKALKLFEDLL